MKSVRTISLICISLMFFISLSACGSSAKISLNDYLDYTVSGYNEYGKVSYSIDKEALKKAIADQISSTNKDISAESLMQDSQFQGAFSKCKFDGSFDRNESLSNGDKIKFKFNVDFTPLTENYKDIKIVFNDITVDVDGLSPTEKFNPFDGLVVTFDGISDRGTVSVNGTKTKNPDLLFIVSEKENLSNGQKITVSIVREGQSKEEVLLACVEDSGLVPTVYEKEYTVEGLPCFAQEFSEVPNSAIKTLIGNADKMVRDRDLESFYSISGGWNKMTTKKNHRIDSLNLVDAYFMTTTTDEEVVNQLVMIYQEDVHYEWYLVDEFRNAHNDRYYNYAIFTNVILSEDKSEALLDMGEYRFCENIIDNGINSNDLTYFYGYKTKDEIYQQYVKSQDYKYIVEKLDLSKYK